MSESNLDIPSTILRSVTGAENSEASNVQSSGTSIVIESDKKAENVPPSKIAKPTDLKLQMSSTTASHTRIGRLCNNIPKPALPPNPYHNGTRVGGGSTASTMSSVSSIRKVSDELARKRLTDVDETDENVFPYQGGGKWAYDRKMSSGSALSDCSRRSDELRKKRSSDASISADSFSDHVKSDFELRRTSDASVVLTEDTDQFIIGDRVWVGGVKAGQIAYIGETQFAPGEWAGIVLDEPIGKNDGTVANIRYFQCPPKKGIFSRLTRLTRYPLVEGGAGEPAVSSGALPDTRRSNGSLLASFPKKSSLVLTPSTSSRNSIMKPPSPDSAAHPNIKVGDRVIVKSSQGSKAGILRYLGTTEFAAGEWCGVELDDPLGKNDGSVAGTRYFECLPKFGLFAPLHKVSKSPASKRLSQANCMVHRGGANPGIPRQGSKESLISISSSASTTASMRSTNRKIGVRTPTTPTSAKNALQETLKEKELHIEQLLKERDLERAEVTRAASQADEAERKLAALKQEFDQQKEEAEARLSDLDAMVCLLKSENEELKNVLDDERKKLEDLQFRLEEETIDKADIKSMSMKYEEKLKMLEKTLFEERKRAEALEQDSNKLFEAEEQMVIMKDELDTVREEIVEHKKLFGALEQEHISLEAHLTSARAEIESLKLENESLKSSASQDQSNLRENLVKASQALEEGQKQLEKKQEEADRLSEEMETRNRAFEEKEKEIHAKYLKIMGELTEKHKSETNNLTRNLDDQKNTSEAKLKILENHLEEKMKTCSILETQLNEVHIVLSKITAEKSVEQLKQKEAEDKLEKRLKETSELLQKKTEDLNAEIGKCEKWKLEKEKLEEELKGVKKSLTSASESTDKHIVSLKGVIKEQKKEIEMLMAELQSKATDCESLRAFVCNSQQENEQKVRELEKMLESKSLEVHRALVDKEKMKADFDSKNKEMKQLNETHEEGLKSRIKLLEDAEGERKKQVETLGKELEKTKNSLEAREKELVKERTNCRETMQKVTALGKNYKEVSEEKDKLLLEKGEAERKLQSLEEKLLQTMSQKTKLEGDISNFINTSNDSTAQLTKLHEGLREKEKEVDVLREELSKKTLLFEGTEQQLKQLLEKQELELKSRTQECEKLKKECCIEVEKLKNKLEAVSTSARETDEEWNKKLENLSKDSENRVKYMEEKIRQMEKKEIEDSNKHEELVKNLLNAKMNLEITLREVQTGSEESKNNLEKQIEALKIERNSILETMEKKKTELVMSEKKLLAESQQQEVMFASESEKLKDELKQMKENLAAIAQELSKEKEEKNKVNEEKLKLEKAAATAEELLKEIQVKNTELEVKASSVESENKILKESIKQLRNEKDQMDKDTTEKMMKLTELRSELERLEFSKGTLIAENEVRIKNLEGETRELKSRLQKTESEKRKEVEDLQRQLEKLKEDSSHIVSGREKELENMKAVVSALRKELEESKHESERRREEANKAEKNLQHLALELEAEEKKSAEFGKRLNESETERIDLKERLDNLTRAMSSSAELNKKLEEISGKLREAEKREDELASSSKLERETLEKMLETTNELLNQRENETKTLAKEVEVLKEEKARLLNKNKTALQTLEREKNALQKKLEETKPTPEQIKTTTNMRAEEGSQREIEEEREFAKGQVDFLNSVIVDMQKKNDALKARIEILEMGFSSEDVDEFSLHNITTRSVAPRLFCDICDRFDLHDTEDCPTQAADDVPPSKSSKSKAPPPERPYCEICEVFGHDTTDCDDAQTF